MIKNLYTRLLQASLMYCLAVLFTACDDIFASEDNPIPAYLSMNDKDVTIKVGDSYKRTAIAVSGAVIEYSSSATDVATVDQSGTVKGVAAGTATITAKATGYSTGGKKIFIEEEKKYEVTVTAAAPSRTYRVYTSATAYTDEAVPDDAINVESSTVDVSWPAGTYVVEGDKTITGNIELTGNVKLILCDGAELTVNGMIDGQANTTSISIYGQTASTGKLTINDGGGLYDINVNNLEIHGGDISATNADQAIETGGTLNIYHGKVTATGPYNGFEALGNFNIYGGTVIATATNPTRMGIDCGGTLTIEDGTVTAIGGDGVDGNKDGGSAISCSTIIINGGTINATGGDPYGTGDGGSGIYSIGDITINGNASVTATANVKNGIGIYANNIQIGQTGTPIVNATGKDYGIRAVTQIDFIAGNVKGTSTGVMTFGGICSGQINYYGGTVEGEGGEGGAGIWGSLGTITNKSGATVTIGRRQYPTEGWTAEDVADNAASTKYNRYMILPMPVAAP